MIENSDDTEFTMTFTLTDLLEQDGLEHLLLPLIRRQVDHLLSELRALFVSEIGIRDIDVPETWVSMNQLFQGWLSAYIVAQDASVPDSARQDFEKGPSL
jgi:hypothetical protein